MCRIWEIDFFIASIVAKYSVEYLGKVIFWYSESFGALHRWIGKMLQHSLEHRMTSKRNFLKTVFSRSSATIPQNLFNEFLWNVNDLFRTQFNDPQTEIIDGPFFRIKKIVTSKNTKIYENKFVKVPKLYLSMGVFPKIALLKCMGTYTSKGTTI